MSDWISRSKLLENTGGDKEIAAEVLEIFRNQIETWGQMLDPADDPQRWADAAHTIKGAALGIGAQKLADVCKVAETTGRGDPSPSRAAAAVMINDIRDVLYPTQDAALKLHHELSRSSGFISS